jgi:hypothetical protein
LLKYIDKILFIKYNHNNGDKMKKHVFICLLLITPIYLYAQNYLYIAVYNGNISEIQKYIKNFNDGASDHESSSSSDLRLFRNTIYAMHGYIFNSKDLQEHFQKFAWYKGTKVDVENELSENELILIRVITAMEKANPPSRDDLVGYWKFYIGEGLIDLCLESNGRLYALDGRFEGYWSLEGTAFRTRITKPDRGVYGYLGDLYEGNENLRIFVFEYKGKLYKTCDFFNAAKVHSPDARFWFEGSVPKEYWFWLNY